MAARSRAQKLAAKRGRPKLPANMNTREPNGRPSRRNERTELLEHEMISTVAATRVRHLGIVDGRDDDGKLVRAQDRALDTKYGFLLGRLNLDGTITEAQFKAGEHYAKDMARGLGMNGMAFPSARAMNLFGIVRGHNGEDGNPAQAKAAQQRMQDLHKVLQSDPFESFHKSQTYRSIQTKRAVEHVVFQVCMVEPEEAPNWPQHMYEMLRKGLNLLVDFYQIK